MKIDFALILTLLALFTGLIWLADKFVFEKRRLAADAAAADPVLVEYAKSLFPVIFLVLMLRSFLAEPFRIPSGSMMPNLLIGDFILVNKFNYGIRLPVFNTKIVEVGAPERGDVFVFRYPGSKELGKDDPAAGTDYIKRVIGIPNDRIQMINGILHINDVAVKKVPVGKDQVGVGAGLADEATYFQETLPNGVTYTIQELEKFGNKLGRNTDVYVVPPGHFFMMGDNRDNSLDSRYWGFVPEANIVGKAIMVWMNFSSLKRIGAID